MQKATLDEYFDLLTTTHSTNLVREFLHNHPEVLQQNPLHYAVLANRKDIVELLLELHVDINATDLQGRTALHYAVSSQRKKIVEILIANNALHIADSKNNTPLHLALMDPEYLMLPTLLECYSAELSLDVVAGLIRNINMPMKIRHAAYLYLVAKAPVGLLREFAKDMNFDYVDSKGNNAILVACQTGNMDALLWLCKTKAQPLTLDVRNFAGDGPVLTATAHGQSDLLMDCLVKPVASGGCGLSLNARNNITGYDTVMTAIANGQVTLLKGLERELKFSMKRYSENQHYSPVTLAIKFGQKEMLAMLVTPVRKGGYGLSINSVGLNQGTNAIECAIFYKQKKLLRELVRPKSQGGFECSFNVRKVLAFAISKPEMLLELVRPVAEGGHGLDFKVCEKHYSHRGEIENLKYNGILALVTQGERETLTDYIATVHLDRKSIQFDSSILQAVTTQGHVEILDDLVTPIAQGGFGLVLDPNSILTAIQNNKCKILLKLISPIQNGGYGVTMDVQTVLQQFLFTYPLDAFFLFLIDHFNKLHLENGIEAAIKWAQETQVNIAKPNPYSTQELNAKRSVKFKKALADHYKELISLCFQNGKINDAHKIATAIEDISPGEGLFFMAEIFNREGKFHNAFQYYLKAFEIKTNTALHEIIGCALVNLILSGKIVQVTNRYFYEMAPRHLGFDFDLDTMQDRAIKAYQYLHGGVSENSVELRHCLDQILAGNLHNPYNIGKTAVWQHDALIKYNDYYTEAAPALLNEPACRRSQAHANLALRELMATQAAKQEPSPSKYSPRFVMPTDKQDSPNDNNRSASKGF